MWARSRSACLPAPATPPLRTLMWAPFTSASRGRQPPAMSSTPAPMSDRSRWRAADTSRRAGWSVEVVAEDLGPGRVPQLGHGLRLDLADPLPGHAVDLADLVQCLGLAVGEAEPHRDHAGLPLGQRVEHRVQLLLEQGEAHGLAWLDRLGVLNQVAELAVAVLAERGVQGDRLAAVLLHLYDLFRGHVQLGRQLLGSGLSAKVLQHLALHAGELV